MPQNVLRRITEFVIAAEGGDYSQRLPEESQGELGDLERAVNNLVRKLKDSHQRDQHHEAFQRDLKLSRAIQTSLLPRELPRIPGTEVAAFYRPAQAVGGDYYDFLPVDEEHTGIVIADASGKGIPGAMFMTIVRNTLRSQALLTLSPREVLERTERLLGPSLLPGLFVSVLYAVLHAASGRLLLSNAGHPPLLHLKPNAAACEWIAPTGAALGVRSSRGHFNIAEREIFLEPGDFLLFYTDGVSDVMTPDGTTFGRDPIGRLAVEKASQGAALFLATLEETLDRYRAEREPVDDMTAVALRRLGGGHG